MSELDYLQAMGIQRWQQRKPTVPVDIVDKNQAPALESAHSQETIESVDPGNSSLPAADANPVAKVVQQKDSAQKDSAQKDSAQKDSAQKKPTKSETSEVKPLENELATAAKQTDVKDDVSFNEPVHNVNAEIDQALLPDSVAQEVRYPYENHNWEQLQACLAVEGVCDSCKQSGFILGDGQLAPQWLFISDAPSNEELRNQRLFTGRAGQLFEAMLSALDAQRDTVYTTSFFKCPPAEVGNILSANCSQLLQQQVSLLKPKVIVTLGEFAAQSLLSSNDALAALRAKTQNYLGVPVYTIYHPRQMLDDTALKADVWHDLKLAYKHTV